VSRADIVITTALIPGRPAPRLITEAMVRGMREGSVIVDLAADGGGNCELTEAGKDTIKHGVTIIGRKNVPGLMSSQSSQLYARNMLNLILEISKNGQINLDIENEIVKSSLITHNGEVVHEMLHKAGK
jgi:NAD(P) transhydrogenase subunit alpha